MKLSKTDKALGNVETTQTKAGRGRRFIEALRKDWQLWVLLLPAIIMVFVFCYLPMYGVQIAFRDFRAAFGISGSPWVGLKHFQEFISSFYFGRLMANTFLLNFYGLLWSFPFPIIMAILLNQLGEKRFKKFTQTSIYVPHFISPVVLVGMLFLFLSPSSGIVNNIISLSGGQPIHFMFEVSWFRPLFIGSGIWQSAGFNTILYIAALTAIDPELYEAASVDGASKLRKIWHIDVPHLIPIIVMLLILNCGTLLVSNVDKALLMQTAGNLPVSDIIGTYVYRMGIAGSFPAFSYTAAIGLFVNVINFFMIITVNFIAKKMTKTGLF